MVSLKNYLRVFIICIITIIICLIAAHQYDKYKEYQLTEPVLKNTIQVINIHEIDEYIIENDDALLYVGVANDKNCRDLETDLKKLFKEHELTDKVIYLNLTNITDYDLFYNSFNEKYAISDARLAAYPAFVIIQDGKIKDLVERKGDMYLNIGDIDYLLDQYEIKEK